MGQQGDLDPVVEVELGEDARDVGLDRRDAEVERRRRSRRWTGPGRPRRPPRARGRSSRARRSPGPGRGAVVRRRRRPGRSGAVVTAGDRTGWPAATRRTASTISAGGVSLRTNPAAPARRARRTCSSASKVVRMRPRARRGGRAAASVAARPSMLGIRMSIRTTSGACRSTSGSTSAPSPASPTTWMSGAPPSIITSPARTSGSSSTMSTPTVHGSDVVMAARVARPTAASRPRRWARAQAARRPGRPVRPARPGPGRPPGVGHGAWPVGRRVADLDGQPAAGRPRPRGRGPGCPGRACGRWSGLPARSGTRCGPRRRGRCRLVHPRRSTRIPALPDSATSWSDVGEGGLGQLRRPGRAGRR